MKAQRIKFKAVETKYKGYHFRSRLEARWAVFLDAIGWKWEYEKEGYKFCDEHGEEHFYLPDFYVNPSDPFWIEVKPDRPLTKEEEEKARLLAACTHPVIVVQGVPAVENIREDLPTFFICGDQGDIVCFDRALNISSYCFSKWMRPGWFMNDVQPDEEDYRACEMARSARFGT